jgi:hypothetical protein
MATSCALKVPWPDYQHGNERGKHCGQHRRSSVALCLVRECPPGTLVVQPIGHVAARCQLVIDCKGPELLARFWAAALEYVLEPLPGEWMTSG